MIEIKQIYRANLNVACVPVDDTVAAKELAEDKTLEFQDTLMTKLSKFKKAGGLIEIEPHKKLWHIGILLEHADKQILEQAVKYTEEMLTSNNDLTVCIDI